MGRGVKGPPLSAGLPSHRPYDPSVIQHTLQPPFFSEAH